MFEAKRAEEYNPNLTYGSWQINEEINIKIPSGRTDKNGNDVLVRKYPSLNTEIEKLKLELQKYYNEQIIPDLFKYELIK